MSTVEEQQEKLGRGPRFVDSFSAALEEHVTPAETAQLLALLLRRAATRKPRRVYEATIGGETDGSGNSSILLFQVPQGYDAHLTRVVVEGKGITPASAATVSNPGGTGWLALFELELGTSVPDLTAFIGSGRDFAPGAAAGAMIPAVFTDNDSNAWAYRSGKSIYLGVFNGPVNTQLAVSLRVNLEPQ